METRDDPTQTPEQKAPKSLRGRRLIPALIILCLLGTIGLLVVKCQSKAEVIREENQASIEKEQPPLNVVTLNLVPGMIRDQIDLPGVTEPWVELTISAEVAGKVVEKVVTEGAAVSKGDVLVRIDSRDYKNAYVSAKASHKLATSELHRLKKLHNRQAVSQSQLDNAVTDLARTRAAMDNARIALERTSIRAPFSGVVNSIVIDEGQYLAVGDPVAEILQIDRLKVRVGIPESDVAAVRRIDRFKVRIDALGGKTVVAKKHFLSKTADPMARLYNLDLELDNSGGDILPDMFTRVEIIKKELPDGLSIPLYSVISRNDDQIVYVVQENRAKARSVKLGLLDGWRVEVQEGLQAGEDVVVVGHRSLNDGEAVKVVKRVEAVEDILK